MEKGIDMELYYAALERNGVQIAKTVVQKGGLIDGVSRTQIHKVYVEQTKKQSEKRDEKSLGK